MTVLVLIFDASTPPLRRPIPRDRGSFALRVWYRHAMRRCLLEPCSRGGAEPVCRADPHRGAVHFYRPISASSAARAPQLDSTSGDGLTREQTAPGRRPPGGQERGCCRKLLERSLPRSPATAGFLNGSISLPSLVTGAFVQWSEVSFRERSDPDRNSPTVQVATVRTAPSRRNFSQRRRATDSKGSYESTVLRFPKALPRIPRTWHDRRSRIIGRVVANRQRS